VCLAVWIIHGGEHCVLGETDASVFEDAAQPSSGINLAAVIVVP